MDKKHSMSTGNKWDKTKMPKSKYVHSNFQYLPIFIQELIF